MGKQNECQREIERMGHGAKRRGWKQKGGEREAKGRGERSSKKEREEGKGGRGTQKKKERMARN
jgi:hypothetical protein